MSKDDERDDVARLLDEVGRREAEERRAGDVLEDVWASSQKRRAPPWPLYLGLAAAAAVVLGMLILRPQTQPSVPGPSRELLGSNELQIHPSDAPPGQWPDHVTWSGPKGLEYKLRIVEYVDGAEGRELFAPPAIIGYKQALPDTRSWPDTIKLSLEARNKEGEEQGSAEAVWERSH